MTTRTHATERAILLAVALGLAVPPAAQARTAEQTVQAIRVRYAQVNADAAHGRKVQRDLMGLSTEGGTLTGWFCGPDLCKMAATFYGETGRATEEYSLWHGRLFFVLRAETRYSHPIGSGSPPPGATRRTEQRFYFDGGRLIRWVDGQTPRPVTSPEARKRARELQASATDFALRLRARPQARGTGVVGACPTAPAICRRASSGRSKASRRGPTRLPSSLGSLCGSASRR